MSAAVRLVAAIIPFIALVAVQVTPPEEPLTPEQRRELAQEGDRLEKEADALTKEKKWPEAVEKYEKALAISYRILPNGHIVQVRLLTKSANFHILAGQPSAAIPKIDQAVVLLRKLIPAEGNGDHAQAVRVYDYCGELYLAADHPERTGMCKVMAFRHTARQYPHDLFTKGHAEVAERALLTGMQALAIGDTSLAREYYLLGVDLYRKLYPKNEYPDGHPDLALALNNTGFFFGQVGDHQAQLVYSLESLSMRRRLYPIEKFPAGHKDLAFSLRNAGFALRALGRFGEARRYLDESLAMARSLASPSLEVSALTNLGFLHHSAGEFEQAAAVYREALVLLEAKVEPNGGMLTQTTLNNLGCVLSSQGKYAEAEKAMNRSLELARKLYGATDGVVFEEARLLANLGDLYARRGETAKGLEYCARGADLFRKRLTAAVGRESEAESLRTAILYPGADGVLSITRGHPEFATEAYAQVWDEKGLVFRVLEYRQGLAKAVGTPAGKAAWTGLQDIRFRLAAAVASPRDVPDRSERIKELTVEKERLERKLAAEFPVGQQQGVVDFGRPAELAAKLPTGTVFIDIARYIDWSANVGRPLSVPDFLAMPCRYEAFVLTPGGKPVRVELGDAKAVDAAVRAWRAAAGLQGDRGISATWSALAAVCGATLAETDTAGFRGLRKVNEKNAGVALAEAGADLRRRIWEPVARALPSGTHTIYICPDGDLARLPWEALPGSAPDRVLLEEFAFARVPHGPFLLRRLNASEQNPTDTRGLFAVGAVDYGRGKDGYPRWVPLPGTGRELDLLAASVIEGKVTTLRGVDATPKRVRSGLTSAPIAHLATHGYYADELLRADAGVGQPHAGTGMILGLVRNPLAYCGLVLADTDEDGSILTGETIAGLSLERLDLVVLSACETGIGYQGGRDGGFGLPRAFHLAGCRNVVASLWPVDDDATAAVMAGFYHRLLVKKQAPLDALREAQLAVFRHPELIPDLSGRRGADALKEAMMKTVAGKLGDVATGPRATVALWAAFHLSGPGR